MKKKISSVESDFKFIIWLTLALLVGVSLYSYSPSDPSFNVLGFQAKPMNWCGYVGSFLSDLLYQTWGLCSWVFVFISVFLSWTSFRSPKAKNSLRWNALWIFTLMLISSALLTLYFPKAIFFSGSVSLGGMVGQFFTSSLLTVLNYVGVNIVLWAAFILSAVTFTERSLLAYVEELELPERMNFGLFAWLSDLFSAGVEKVGTQIKSRARKQARESVRDNAPAQNLRLRPEDVVEKEEDYEEEYEEEEETAAFSKKTEIKTNTQEHKPQV